MMLAAAAVIFVLLLAVTIAGSPNQCPTPL